jgi:hypothetical protein
MGMHRHAWITLTECAEHIPVDVPNDRARVTYLMNSLKTVDPTVLAAIAAVCQDKADKCVNFGNTFNYWSLFARLLLRLQKNRKGSL